MKKKTKRSRNKLRFHRYIGISLAGGKNDKTCLSCVDYYPKAKRVILSVLEEKFGQAYGDSADKRLFDLVTDLRSNIKLVGFDVPLQLPKCIRCQLKCPGYDDCKEPEIQWMWNHYSKVTKKNKKIFTPYTQSCSELFLSTEIEDVFWRGSSLGSNLAPLAARAHYFCRRLSLPCIEVYPELSLYRIGMGLKIGKKYLRMESRSLEKDECRKVILRTLVEKGLIFVYQDDLQRMVDNSYAFDSLICALTAYLSDRGQCQKRPKGFPKDESWIHFPVLKPKWA